MRQKPLRLIMDGYTDYFTATSMYAADQAGIKVIAPYVEAQDAQGKWVRVVEDMGFPAGLERTMVADLSGENSRRHAADPHRHQPKNLLGRGAHRSDSRIEGIRASAKCRWPQRRWRFSAIRRKFACSPASDTMYSYSRRSTTGPYARAAGNYTRYGDVKTLLERVGRQIRGVRFRRRRQAGIRSAAVCPRFPRAGCAIISFMPMALRRIWIFTPRTRSRVEPLPRHGLLRIRTRRAKSIRRTTSISVTNWNTTRARVRIVCRGICATNIPRQSEEHSWPKRRRHHSGRRPGERILRVHSFDRSEQRAAFALHPADTKERIDVAARHLGYRPNPLARSLRSQRSNIVGVMVFDITDPFCTPILRGLENALYQANYLSFLADAHNEPHRFERYLEMLLDRRVEGLIVIANWLVTDIKLLADLTERQVPTVVAGREFEDRSVEHGVRGQ